MCDYCFDMPACTCAATHARAGLLNRQAASMYVRSARGRVLIQCMPAAVDRQEVDKATATGMAQTNWKTMLDSLSKLLNRCSSEELVLQLLKVVLLVASGMCLKPCPWLFPMQSCTAAKLGMV